MLLPHEKLMEAEIYIEKQKEAMELLMELAKKQNQILSFLNKTMFETVKTQRSLDSDKQNEELLQLAWGANDIIADNPRMAEIIKLLSDEFTIDLK